MGQKSGPAKEPAEQVIKEIRRDAQAHGRSRGDHSRLRHSGRDAQVSRKELPGRIAQGQAAIRSRG